jgi:hypothetical protein
MSTYLGDYPEDATVHFIWSTNDGNGASITRTVDGTIKVYKDNGLVPSSTGITDTEDLGGVTGVHACTIDTNSDAFYVAGADYAVVLNGATIDSQSVNAILAHFSIQNRYGTIVIGTPFTPYSIDLANTAYVFFGIALSTNRGALPTTAEIIPGTFSLARKAKGETIWTTIRNRVALEKYTGIVRWGEEFNAANGYAEGDSIRIIFYNVAVVLNGVTHEITSSTGSLYFTHIRETGVKEMYAKLPNEYIMGSSVQTSMDNEINALITSTGHISTIVDALTSSVSAIPTNPMLDSEDGSSFTDIPDMAKESTLLEVQTSTGHISQVVDELDLDLSLLPIIDSKVDELITSTGHISETVDDITILIGAGGTRTVTITVNNNHGATLGDASVQLWGSNLTNLVTYGYTDSNGIIVRSVNDGIYKVKVRKNGYSFEGTYDLTVTADVAITYTGETFTPDPPAEITQCRVYGYIVDASATEVEGALIQFVLAEIPLVDTSTGSAVSVETAKCTTDENGYFYIDLMRNTNFIVIIQQVGLKEVIRTPDEPMINLFELLGVTEEQDNPQEDWG